MSSKASKLKKSIKRQTPEEYRTLVGSIVTTVGIITGKSELQIRKTYNMLKKNKQVIPTTVSEICDYVWSIFGDNSKIALRANMVLVFDRLNVRTPLVTFVNGEGNIMPLSPSGEYTGILMTAASGSENVDVEFLYNEDGGEIEDEEN